MTSYFLDEIMMIEYGGLKNMKHMRNEEAVSPVIGVILMVVITVIIAAVLAVFAFGVGAPTKGPTASIKITNVDVTNGLVTVQHFGGDAIKLVDTKIIIEELSPLDVVLGTTVFTSIAATGTFAAGDTLTLDVGADSVSINGATAAASNSAAVAPGFSKGGTLALASGNKLAVTVIDIKSGGVLSKPAVTI
jgi:flagellin-like protein